MPGSSEVSVINRQKFLAELAKLLSFMYEEDRRYALDMYERMFDIAEGSEQWLIQNLMSPTRQAVIIARSYNAKERKLSVSAEWKEEEEEDQGGETPPFVLAINKIFDDLFPDNENLEETDSDQVSFFEQDVINKETKKHRMPKAAVLLNQTQEFESVTASAAEGMTLEDTLEEKSLEDNWTDRSAFDAQDEIEAEPDPRVQIVDRKDFYDFTEEEPVPGSEAKSVETASDSETAIQTGAETSERESVPQRGTGTSVEEQLEETPQPPEQPKKRRSIEELLGFRKGKKRSEGSERTTAELEEAVKQAMEVQHDPVGLTEKMETESVGSADADASSRSLPEQKELAKSSIKAVPLEAPDVLPEEETAPIKAEPEKPAYISSPDENETQKKNKKEAESETVVTTPQEQNAESKEPQKLFFELPEEEPVIRKPEPKKREEEAVAVRKVPNVPAMILFFIVAIPSVPVMLVLLALLVALCVSLSFGVIALGSILVISAFSGFAVLADILLLLGAAIIALALGLLFLWLAIWLIAEGMVGLIRSVKELYREWCFKEVPAV